MKSSPQVPPKQLVEVMKDEIEQYVKGVMKAVNEAKDGEWIAGSEEPVRNLSAELRRRIFERAIQQRVDAAEAAFPPPHHPTTGKRLAIKRCQSRTVLTINGRVQTLRRWWFEKETGSIAPTDLILDRTESTITPGALEIVCRENFPPQAL